MINTVLVSDLIDVDTPPEDTRVIFKVGHAIVACSPSLGRPQVYLDPAEDPELGRVYVYLKAKKTWVEIDLVNDAGEQIAHDILIAYDKAMKELEDDYLDRRELY